MLLIGYDIGSSSIKASLLNAQTGKVLALATSPKTEMEISAPHPGWAEQQPQVWWQHIKITTAEIKSQVKFDPKDVRAIGLSYQMHGLVVVDKNRNVLRPSIIWCDSRAVPIGEKALAKIGSEKCLQRLLNFPGNFTASKLRWIRENEPSIYKQIDKAMLPGEYIAMLMTDEIVTTPSGLSEWILWDYQDHEPAKIVLDEMDISPELIPKVMPNFSIQGELTQKAAIDIGLTPGTPVSYRAGDQPNNALSLNVLDPGEVAATAGTSGVVYGIGGSATYDVKSRVNTFIHVNHSETKPRYGVLLCLNGTGSLNRWLKNNLTIESSYPEMNDLASKAPIGAENLVILPFGNGAERTLENRDIGASIHGLRFNCHQHSHILRAAQEGIVFALNYGLEIFQEMEIKIKIIRAGFTNMFLSPLFTETFATVSGAQIELFDTDGSQGAARGAGIGAGIYRSLPEAFTGLKRIVHIEPNYTQRQLYLDAYKIWKQTLAKQLNQL